MLQVPVDNSIRKEVSESIFEYLLGEILFPYTINNSNNDNINASTSNKSTSIETSTNSTEIEQRLELIGYDVGYRLLDKVSLNNKFIGTDPLDLVKFVCKEFWEEVFRKKVDKLQTNHRGVFVLSDLKFKWLEKYSSDDIESKQAAERMLHFPCGMLRGALANLGVLAMVNADFNVLPACTFNIRIKTS